MIDRSANWTVILRVNDKADWCVYGPGTLRQANEFRKKSVGCGMERAVAQLIPFPRKETTAALEKYWGLRDYGVPGQFGLEPLLQDYIAGMVEVFREIRRALRPDGTAWVNMGDSYVSVGSGTQGKNGQMADRSVVKARAQVKDNKAVHATVMRPYSVAGLQPKNLIGTPWRLAFALQADGWWLRQDIIWNKKNPMPESVTDRCTKSHEYIFLLAKSERYYFDAKAIAEPVEPSQQGRVRDDAIGGASWRERGQHSEGGRYTQRKPAGWDTGSGAHGTIHRDGRAQEIEYTETDATHRNKRSVWTVGTHAFPEAHFATFPPDLIEPCILAGCPEDGTVLDPFGGAGTTGLVADRNHRDAILIELNPEYAAMAEKRISGDAPLFAEVQCL
jgi:DNA modification methylase